MIQVLPNFRRFLILADSESHADGLHFHKRGSESCPSGYTDLGSLGFCIRNNNLDKAPKDALKLRHGDQQKAVRMMLESMPECVPFKSILQPVKRMRPP